MFDDRASWRMKMRRAGLALTAAYVSIACLDGSAVWAQSIMRAPSVDVRPRIPTITPTVAPRVVVTPHVDPSIAGRAVTGLGRTTPNLKTYQSCSYAYRNSDGTCSDQTISSAYAGR